MNQKIPTELRQEVAERANYRCEYCLVPERFLATVFHVDHIRSRKHGGGTTADNLAYACPHCNQFKGSNVATFIDDEQTIRFFNPRKDAWADHFAVEQGEIIGRTAIGQATLTMFNFNQIERVMLRVALIEVGEYSTP